MSKFVLSAGIAWVFLSLIIGILLVSTQPVQWVMIPQRSSESSQPVNTELHRISQNKATSKVHIAGTPEETAETADTSVTIKK